MTRYVRDLETIRLLRWRAATWQTLIVGLIFLGSALYHFHAVGLPTHWFPIAYVGIGSALITVSICLFIFGVPGRRA